MRKTAAIPLLLAGISLPAQAAKTEEPGPKTLAVQNRLHTMRHEFGGWIGVLPWDAFTKGLTFTGAYTLHLNDLFAWEIGQFTYSIGMDTRLNDELANLPQPVGPTPFEVVDYYLTSNFMLKPVYGKMTIFNRKLIYNEAFLVAGGGVGWLTITTRPVLDIGVGTRIYASSHLSFRFDVRNYSFLSKGDLENEVWLGLGGSLAFGGG